MQSLTTFRPQPAPAELRTYASLHQLRERLTAMEHSAWLSDAYVVIVLDDHFSGHLPALIRRREVVGGSLTLVRPSGRIFLPASLKPAASGEDLLGWQAITFASDLDDAFSSLADEAIEDHRRIVFWPAWRDSSVLRQTPLAGHYYCAGGSR